MPEFEPGNDKEYKVEAIRDSAAYTKAVDGHLPGLYYMVTWKGYPKEKSSWEPSSTVMHLWKMVSTFYKKHLEKPTATLAPLNSAPPMAKPTIQLSTKQKRGRPTGPAKMHTK